LCDIVLSIIVLSTGRGSKKTGNQYKEGNIFHRVWL
jgi:hypothetical protein